MCADLGSPWTWRPCLHMCALVVLYWCVWVVMCIYVSLSWYAIVWASVLSSTWFYKAKTYHFDKIAQYNVRVFSSSCKKKWFNLVLSLCGDRACNNIPRTMRNREARPQSSFFLLFFLPEVQIINLKHKPISTEIVCVYTLSLCGKDGERTQLRITHREQGGFQTLKLGPRDDSEGSADDEKEKEKM